MKPRVISRMPTIIGDLHESCFRSAHIVEKVKEWLRGGIGNDALLLELIEDMEDPIETGEGIEEPCKSATAN